MHTRTGAPWFQQKCQILDNRGEIFHTVQAREIRECPIKRAIISKDADFFSRQHAKIDAFACACDTRQPACAVDHGGRNIAGQNAYASASKVNGINAGTAIELEDALARLENTLKAPPYCAPPCLAD